jgi:hypothetical protein
MRHIKNKYRKERKIMKGGIGRDDEDPEDEQLEEEEIQP